MPIPVTQSDSAWYNSPGAQSQSKKRRRMSRSSSASEEAPPDKKESVPDRSPPVEQHDVERMTAESRMELMARIKSEIRPTWLQQNQDEVKESPAEAPRGQLLPSVNIAGAEQSSSHTWNDNRPTSAVERPRSAWHRGDFRPEATEQDTSWTSTSPTTPWFSQAFARQLPPQPEDSSIQSPNPFATRPRARAASNSSLSTSFIFRAPTSPLATASHVDEFDTFDLNKSNRRRTFSPNSFWTRHSYDDATAPDDAPVADRGGTFPRRSLSSFQHAHSFSGVTSPNSRPRRPSFSPDVSPAPLVGRYEESILRGRMSSTPSKPLEFVAQIGVLGKDPCRQSLKCPAHVSVPFPAVFYDYGSGLPLPAADGPSPYVGLVDLENNLTSSPGSNRSRVRKSRSSSDGDSTKTSERKPKVRRRKHKSPTVTPHYKRPQGSYRIPQQGQLQIIIKNPNKTAVKLFLVPYDLSGMTPGTKTFVRQRSYTAGPIIDMPLNTGNQPNASISNAEHPLDRPTLRYLIHVHICCTSKTRFYLYRSIRVVFANRVPDGKERLRSEIQLPEPKYSTWKPTDPDHPAQQDVNVVNPALHDPLSAAPPNDFQSPDPFASNTAQPETSSKRLMPFSRFSRTPLPAILSRATSAESGTLPTLPTLPIFPSRTLPHFEPMSPMSLDAASPRSDGEVSPRHTERSSTLTPVAEPASMPFRKVTRSAERSPSRTPRKGLLALQLRDWAGRGGSANSNGSGNGSGD